MTPRLDVLVVFPPISVARDFIDYPYVSDLGAVQLASVLEGFGAEVQLVDAFGQQGAGLRWCDDGRAQLGVSVAAVLAACERPSAPDVVVVAYTPFHRPPLRDELLGATLRGFSERWPGTPLWLADCYQSGQHYVDAPFEAVLAAYPELDLWVKYEAEVTVPALLARLAGGERPRGGFAGAAPPDLDALPFPAWERVDLVAYERFHDSVVRELGRGPWHFRLGGRTLPMVTSRGCPFTCVHCSSNPGRGDGETKTQRRYSAERLRAYLRRMVERHGATRLEVLDELINVNERHFDAFLDEVARLGVAFDAPNGMRADYLEPRHLAAMRGRVTTLSVSAESGVQRVVTEVVHKRLELGAIIRAAEQAQRAGVPLLIHYIIGLPGETAEEVNGTLAFALDLYARFGAEPAVQFATPLPGTELARGRSLPVVSDWGPYFQTAPSQPDALVPPEALRGFLSNFQARLAAERQPVLTLDVTHVCNNACPFCPVSPVLRATEHPAGHQAALVRGREGGARTLRLDGGEPTLYPGLLGLLAEARVLGYERVELTTNGRLLAYPSFAQRLLLAGLERLSVSLHGADARTHGLHVSDDDAFAQTLAGLRNARRYLRRPRELAVSTALTRHNVPSLSTMLALVYELGVPEVELRALWPFGSATSDWRVPSELLGRQLSELLPRWESRLRLRIHGVPPCFLSGVEHLAALDEDLLGCGAHEQAGLLSLADHRRAHRTRRPVCDSCPSATRCGGFWASEARPLPWAGAAFEKNDAQDRFP